MQVLGDYLRLNISENKKKIRKLYFILIIVMIFTCKKDKEVEIPILIDKEYVGDIAKPARSEMFSECI